MGMFQSYMSTKPTNLDSKYYDTASDKDKYPFLKQECLTQFEYDEFTFEWKIDTSTYSKQSIASFEFLKSPIFRGGDRGQHSWQLCWRREYSSVYRNCAYALEVHLIAIGNTGTCNFRGGVQAKAFISFKKPQLNSDFQVQRKENCLLTLRPFGPGEVINRHADDNVISPEDIKNFLIDDVFTVYCRIVLSCGNKHSGILVTNKKEENYLKKNNAVFKILEALLTSPDFADVNLVTCTQTFPAYKAILSAQSPVFAAMFRSDMLESKSNAVKIVDFEDEVVEGMLEYIYTGQTSKIPEHCSELFRIADKYEVLELKKECCSHLCSNLTLDNALKVLQLANLLDAMELKDFTLQFINWNKEKLLDTEAFKDFAKSDPSLLLDLYAKV